MSKETKNTTPANKPKFSNYWIYGLIVVIFIAISMFSGNGGFGEPIKISYSEYTKYLKEGDIDLVFIITNRQ